MGINTLHKGDDNNIIIIIIITIIIINIITNKGPRYTNGKLQNKKCSSNSTTNTQYMVPLHYI